MLITFKNRIYSIVRYRLMVHIKQIQSVNQGGEVVKQTPFELSIFVTQFHSYLYKQR